LLPAFSGQRLESTSGDVDPADEHRLKGEVFRQQRRNAGDEVVQIDPAAGFAPDLELERHGFSSGFRAT
jgi:hypothetical protein